jgi:large subunit ribosomal protein L24
MQRKRPDTRHQERTKIRLHVGDEVEVISGKGSYVETVNGQRRGQRGKIAEILRGSQRVRVAGVNLITKHQRASGRSRAMQQQAGRIQMPGALHISNVMLVCPTCAKRTRPRYAGEDAGGKQRLCRECGADIARPSVEE